MCKFKGYKLTMKLEAQMPMIHFQSEQVGATLRASEMKPKFDKYLLDILCKEKGKDIAGLKKDNEYKEIFLDTSSDENNALDYKVQITILESGEVVKINEFGQKDLKYNIFYGNSKNAKKLKRGVFSNPTVTIICFKAKLRELIEKNLVDFFLTKNFGTMQNKGFGSFVPSEWLESYKSNLQEDEVKNKMFKDVVNAYQKLIPIEKCYYMDFKDDLINDKNMHCVKISNSIKEFYSIMKSGKKTSNEYKESYIYQYGCDKLKLYNEKHWMKGENLENKKYKFFRVLLGLGKNIGKFTIYNAKFDRIPSPIYFKVILDKVFIVAFDVPTELFKKKFIFNSTNKTGEICTPDTFNMQEFLEYCIEKYNNDSCENDSKVIIEEVNSNA